MNKKPSKTPTPRKHNSKPVEPKRSAPPPKPNTVDSDYLYDDMTMPDEKKQRLKEENVLLGC